MEIKQPVEIITFHDTDEVFNIMAKNERYIIASRPYTIAERNAEIKEWKNTQEVQFKEHFESQSKHDDFEEFCEDDSICDDITDAIEDEIGRCPEPLDEDAFCYTIIDLKEKVRGGDNYYCRFNYSKVEECEKALLALSTITKETQDCDFKEYELGISRRTRVDLQIKEPHIPAFEVEA